MRYKKVYRDGVYVLVDPLTSTDLNLSGAGVWDFVGSVASKLIPIGKKVVESGIESGAKKLGEYAATKAVDKITAPKPTPPVKPLGDQIVKELSKPPEKKSIEERVNLLLNM